MDERRRRDDSLTRRLAIRLTESHPEAAAETLESHDPAKVAIFLKRLDPRKAGELLGSVSAASGARIAAAMTPAETAALIGAMRPTRAALLFQALPKDLREQVLLEGGGVLRDLKKLIGYPRGTAGRLMDVRFLAVSPESTARDALRQLRRFQGVRVFTVFVTDAEHRLLGAASLQDVAAADPKAKITDLAQADIVSVHPWDKREIVVDMLDNLRAPSIPVVDHEGTLVGVIRPDSLASAAEQEAAADVAKIFGATAEEGALSAVSFSVRKRLPWLSINLATAFLAASVVGLFEGVIGKFTALAVLLPVVAGQSGNTGAQALGVAIRALATREIDDSNLGPVVWKELRVGLVNGMVIAAACAAGVYVWSGQLWLAGVIGGAMVTSMALAAVSGAAIPMLLEKAGFDPATSSSVILTTVTDVVGFLSFLGLAALAVG